MRTVTLRRSLTHAIAVLTLASIAGALLPATAIAGVEPPPICSDKPMALIKGTDTLIKTYERRTILTVSQSYDLRTFTRISKQAIWDCRIADSLPPLDAFVAYTENLRDTFLLAPDKAATLINPINEAIAILEVCTCTALTAGTGGPSPAPDDASAAPAPCEKGLVLLNLLRVTVKDLHNRLILTVTQYETMDAQLATAHQSYVDCRVADALQQARNFEKYVEWLYRTGVLDRQQANELLDIAAQAITVISTCGC